jgi:hypothetical protein
MRIKGSGRLKKSISKYLGRTEKNSFIQFIYSAAINETLEKKCSRTSSDIELVTFVNADSFPDLMLSVFSFTNAAGAPAKWTLYLDGDLTENQHNILSKLNFISISGWDKYLDEAQSKKYGWKWQLKKFAAYAMHPASVTTVFLDSDIIFYPLFAEYINCFKTQNWYLPEPAEGLNIDKSLIELYSFKKTMYLVNAGFLVLNHPLKWDLGFEYIDSCSQEQLSLQYFTDQSALNLMFYNDTHANILDPRVFHASANDHFNIDSLSTHTLALRHYVGLIRHKMWQNGWKQFI